MGEALVRQNKLTAAALLADQWRRQEPTFDAGALLAARVHVRRGETPAAIQILHQRAEHPAAAGELLDELARLLFDADRPHEAESALMRLSALRPQDPAVLHNLGSLYHLQDRLPEAAKALRRSLELRPDAAATRLLLEQIETRQPSG